jgi:hypothetical protein
MKSEARGLASRTPGTAEVRAVTLLFAALVLLATYPLWLHPASTMLPGGPDGELFVWTLAWDAHAFLHQPFAIFDANIYHPLRDTLAFSENLIGTAIFSAPVQWLTGNPVFALNVVSLLSTLLCGVGTWLLARRLGLGRGAAVIAGLVFAFAPPRFFRMEQLHLGMVHWIPFGLASLHAYFDDGRARDLKWAALFFALQVLSSGHGAVFMVIACGALFLYRVALGEPLRLWRRARDLGVTGLLLLAPVVWVALPYRRVQEEQGLRRSLDGWIVPATSFFAAPTHLQKWVAGLMPDARVLETASASLFPGFLTLILAAAALILKPSRGKAAGAIDKALAVAPVRHEKGVGNGPAAASVSDAKGAGRGFPARSEVEGRPDETGARDTRAVWLRRGAVLLEVLALALIAIALWVSFYRPGRVRVGDIVLFSARSLWRPWLLAAIAVAARVALLRRVPFDTLRRIRRRVTAWVTVWVKPRLSAAWEAVVSVWRPRRIALRDSALAFYGLLTFLTVLLTVGPPLGIWPLVYWMPGFSFIRVPSRFTILGMLGLAVLAGIGFDRVRERLQPGRRRIAAIVVCVLFMGEFLAIPLEVNPYRVEIPQIDRWLAAQPGSFAIAEVPLPDPVNPGEFERRQTAYMMHASAHWQKTVHGYSGFRATLHERLFQSLREFPSDEGLRRLTGLGVSRVVVHTDLYEPGDWAAVEARIGRFPDLLRLEHVEGAGRVYSLRPPAPQ